MRSSLLWVVVLGVLVLTPPVGLADDRLVTTAVGLVEEPPVVVAFGPATHSIEASLGPDGVPVFPCRGDGVVTLTFDLAARRFYGVMASDGCSVEVIGSPATVCCPVFERFSVPQHCERLPSRAIDCSFTTSTVNATIVLGADGAFTYDYLNVNTGFHETILGELTRS